MRIDIMTLFPEMFDKPLSESIIGRAREKGIIEINCHQIRDYTQNKQKQVDDYPYGGGWGCVMMAQPLKSCLDSILEKTGGLDTRVIYLSPQGKPFNQETAKRLKNDYNHLVLVCGHYEGIDERFIEKCVDEEISLGDFVLTGGEIAAMAITDCVCRLVPGVLSDEECYTGESHWDGLLEYPQYTRPEIWEDLSVPDVLLEGDHSKIEDWRHEQMLKRTKRKRPDMFDKLTLSDDDMKAVLRPDLNTSFRKATFDDIDKILEITSDAKALLKRRKIDQWQGDYPSRDVFVSDIDKGECYVVENEGKIAAFFTLTTQPQINYDEISDGKWYSSDMPYCTIHRSAVAKEYLGTGLSTNFMRYIDEICRGYGLRCIRVDTHKNNKAMQRLLRDCNYKYRGNVLVNSEPGRDPKRQAYEKVLKK